MGDSKHSKEPPRRSKKQGPSRTSRALSHDPVRDKILLGFPRYSTVFEGPRSPAVNRRVVGSNPTRGARFKPHQPKRFRLPPGGPACGHEPWDSAEVFRKTHEDQ